MAGFLRNMIARQKEMAESGLGPFQKAGAPTDGTSGSFFGEAGPGALLIDTTNKKLYINTNTKASPTWTVVGSQS